MLSIPRHYLVDPGPGPLFLTGWGALAAFIVLASIGVGGYVWLYRRNAPKDKLLTNRPPVIPLVTYSSIRDAGTTLVCTFPFIQGRESEQLRAVLRHLRNGDEVSTPLPEADGELAIRRVSHGYEKKIGRHGAHGAWRPVRSREAVEWLHRGALYAVRFAGDGYGGVVTFQRG